MQIVIQNRAVEGATTARFVSVSHVMPNGLPRFKDFYARKYAGKWELCVDGVVVLRDKYLEGLRKQLAKRTFEQVCALHDMTEDIPND